MNVEQGLTEYLAAHAPLVALIGEGRVFFAQAPQVTGYDYIVVFKITGGRIGRVGFGAPLMQISCFSADSYRALAMAELVIAALDGYQATWGGSLLVSGDYRDDQVLFNEGVFHAPVEIRMNYLEV